MFVINSNWQYAVLSLLSPLAFFFLVFYTGVPMAEKNSLKRRGEIYRVYQENTSMFIPWFPGNYKGIAEKVNEDMKKGA